MRNNYNLKHLTIRDLTAIASVDLKDLSGLLVLRVQYNDEVITSIQALGRDWGMPMSLDEVDITF